MLEPQRRFLTDHGGVETSPSSVKKGQGSKLPNYHEPQREVAWLLRLLEPMIFNGFCHAF